MTRVQLRDIRPEDQSFLLQVYASTRADELALVDWSDEQKQAFVNMQFDAQWTYYHGEYPAATWHIIQRDGVDIGRWIVHRADDEILLMDVALLAEYRGAGVGSQLMRDLMDEAAATRQRIRLHVEKFNRALHWYQRLGFQAIGDSAVYLEMEWQPE